ncbi:MAG: hypothetical protein IIZ06_09215 [Kiritimatiellae bacterium]|nr:hypothetical protein [Kiritimatiellia bacterium]
MDWITLINALTGTEMSVPESRLDEYLKAGHRLANHQPEAEPPKPAEPAPKAETPKRKTKPKAKA